MNPESSLFPCSILLRTVLSNITTFGNAPICVNLSTKLK